MNCLALGSSNNVVNYAVSTEMMELMNLTSSMPTMRMAWMGPISMNMRTIL
jgi:hypothetical protein